MTELVAVDIGGRHARCAIARVEAPYEHLLPNLIEDDPPVFVRRGEVEVQWAWVDAARDGRSATAMQPKLYRAGTRRPLAADGLAERGGVSRRG